jgi:4-hydroxythreonine-4-phosphate dehydrogenase
MKSTGSQPLVVTMGEPAGIGGELVLKAWLGREKWQTPCFFVVDDPSRLQRLADRLEWHVPIVSIEDPQSAVDVFSSALPVLAQHLPGSSTPGHPDAANAPAVIGAIREATSLVMAGQASAVVTNPINKQVLYETGFTFPGHTEFLAELAGDASEPVMMLVCPDLKVIPVTVHLALIDAIRALNKSQIVTTVKTAAAAMVRDFGIDRPHLAVAALNPHAGEGGYLGNEEIDVIAPAVAELKAHGLSVSGPTPADTLFHERARQTYDAVICMYHDQALLPAKTIDFSNGVNVTLGLPFVRTSPDHGTAFEIAGTGVADETSFISALSIAAQIVERRIGNNQPGIQRATGSQRV